MASAAASPTGNGGVGIHVDGDAFVPTEEPLEFVFSVPEFQPGDALSIPAPDGTRLKLRLPRNAKSGDRMYMGKNDRGEWVITRVSRPQSRPAQLAAGSGDDLILDSARMKDEKLDPNVLSIMCLGDSHTHGWHVPGGYRIHLWELIQRACWNVRFVGNHRNGPKTIDRRHEGWPGYTIEELICGRGDNVDVNLSRDLPKFMPDIILLLIGTNDVIQEIDLDNVGHRFVKLLDLIQTQVPSAKVVFGNLPNVRGMEACIETVNQQLVEVQKASNQCGLWSRLIDINSLLEPRDFQDSAHLSVRGFNKVARAFFKALEEPDVVPQSARSLPRGSQQRRQESVPASPQRQHGREKCSSSGSVTSRRFSDPSLCVEVSPRNRERRRSSRSQTATDFARNLTPRPQSLLKSPRRSGAESPTAPATVAQVIPGSSTSLESSPVAAATVSQVHSQRRTQQMPSSRQGGQTRSQREPMGDRDISPPRNGVGATHHDLQVGELGSSGTDETAIKCLFADSPPRCDDQDLASVTVPSPAPGPIGAALSQVQSYLDDEDARRRELAVREDILRRVQHLQSVTESHIKTPCADLVANKAAAARIGVPPKPAKLEITVDNWADDLEDDELACVIC